ncbi:MAG TPA: glycosyltransferase, partial [Pyrinomonadaceae bacterium]|nr:glycosyltransferase [Pyrinomonadaceae bacterium]
AVIHLGVEDRAGDDALSLKGNSAAAGIHRYVLFLSRLHPKKGLENLLHAFLSLAKESDFREWRLVVAGSGSPDYVESLKRIATKYGAGDRVLFTGWLSGADKPSVLRNASLLALPSYQENFGLCVMEALAEGVPVLISPHVNLAPQIEKAEAGWISSLETGALRSALAAALSSKEERQKRGLAGRTLAKNFTWPIIAQQLTDLYMSVASK